MKNLITVVLSALIFAGCSKATSEQLHEWTEYSSSYTEAGFQSIVVGTKKEKVLEMIEKLEFRGG